MQHRPQNSKNTLSVLITAYLSANIMIVLFAAFPSLAHAAEAESSVHWKSRHYLEQLSKRMNEPVRSRLWRKYRAYPHLDRGSRLIASGRFKEALEVYETYLRVDPDHCIVRWNQLILHAKVSDSKVLIASATDFLNCVPGFGPALMIRGFAYLKNKMPDRAENDFRSALQDKSLLPDDRTTILEQSFSLAYQRNDFSRSREIARELIDKHPQNPAFHENYAQALYRLNRFEESEHQWQKVESLSTDPAFLRRAALSRATILIETGQYDRASRMLSDNHCQLLFEDGHASISERVNYLCFKATVSHKLEDSETAQVLFEKAMAILINDRQSIAIKKSVQSFLEIGNAAYDAHFLPLALHAYTSALCLHNNRQTRIMAAETAWQLKRFESTADLLRPLVFGSPNTPLIRAETAGRLCTAYEKQGLDRQASICFDQLSAIYPRNHRLLARAAEAAARIGRTERQSDYLHRCYAIEPSSKTALSIGYLHLRNKRIKKAIQWFQKSYRMTPTAETGLAYANGLLSDHRAEAAIGVLKRTKQLAGISHHQSADLYATLASAYMQQNRFADAADAWQCAFQASPDPIYAIRRMEALGKSGNLEMALALASKIQIAGLPSDVRLAWYDEAGDIFQQAGRLLDSLRARQTAVSLAPTYQRHLSLSMLLLEMNRLSEAERSVDHALILRPRDRTARLHKAYILAAKGDNLGATRYLEQIKTQSPGDDQILQSLGRLYLRIGRQEESIMAFKQAIDVAEAHPQHHDRDRVNYLRNMNALQFQMAELDRRLSYSLTQHVTIGENNDRRMGLQSSGAISQTFGAVEASYRPYILWDRFDRINEFYSNVMWSEESDASSEDKTSIQGRVGFKIKPFASINLRIGPESLFPLKDDAASNVLLRMSHSVSRKPWLPDNEDQWQNEPDLYLHTFIEIGKAFFDDQDIFGDLQARLGHSFKMGSTLYLSPFSYFLANGFKNDLDRDSQLQTGLGIAIDFFAGYHRYKGYRRHVELLLQLGVDMGAGLQENNVTGLISLRLT